MDNTLAYIDQASFLGLRAFGHGPVIQFTWIYSHEVDVEALRRFHRNLGRGLLGRRIERSPLPFGRHRWIAWPGPADIAVAATAAPRDEVFAWFDEQAALPIDPERGPSFRLAMRPIVGGGAALTLVISHTVADGVGGVVSVAQAAGGSTRELGYSAVGRSAILPVLLADTRRFLREIPAALRAAVALARLTGKRRDAITPPARVRGVELRGVQQSRSDQFIGVPAVTVYGDAQLWDQRAAELGGNRTSLFIGFAARMAGRLGWVTNEGLVEVTVPVNERTRDDTRGNALIQVSMTVAPDQVCADLSTVRAGLKTALSGLAEARRELLTPLPLVPLVPRALVRRLEGMVVRTGVIGSSNLGDVDPAANRPDGTDADYFAARLTENLTLADLRRTGGTFFPVGTGQVNGKVFLTIGHSNAAGTTTRAELIDAVNANLNDFGLSARVE